ncbi:methylenetetrahydrofolate reductase C-terminal domain-containing protein [Chloroflexota bacterium]
MIVGKQKPLDEIREMIAPYKRVLVLGCGTCVAICFAGGEKEVGILASALRIAATVDGREQVITEHTIKRQCEWEFISELEGRLGEVDAVLSLACGVGVQDVAEKSPGIPVLPGLDTVFMGTPREMGLWTEECAGCGKCVLDKTGGVCPVTRCAKSLLNGPCGGTRKGGACEVDAGKDCAWVLILRRLEELGRMDLMEVCYPPKDYQAVVKPGKVEAGRLISEEEGANA